MNELVLTAYAITAPMIPYGLWLFLQRKAIDRRQLILLTLFGFCVSMVFLITNVGTLYDLLRPSGWRWDQIHLDMMEARSDRSGFLPNTLLFLPAGILMTLIWKKDEHFPQILVHGFLLSLVIEISQLWNNRITDVDDLFFNTLGAVTGWLLVKGHSPQNTCPVSWSASIGLLFLGRFFLFNELWLARLLHGF